MIHVQAPASKSISHRTLIAAALADGESGISNLLDSDDLLRTRSVLTAAGARITTGSDGISRVVGVGGRVRGGSSGNPRDCDVHESGTTCRLMTAVLAAGTGAFLIHGAGRMHERPIGTLVEALRALGAKITCTERGNCPPLLIETEGLNGGDVSISLDESSQFLSGMLLAAPLAKQPLTITPGGTKAVSWPYVSLTLETLQDFGVPFRVEELTDTGQWQAVDWRTVTHAIPQRQRFVMRPAPYHAGQHTIEGDWSGASYLLAAGAVHKPVFVEHLRGDSLQGDRVMADILQRMGAEVAFHPEGVSVHPGLLHGIDIDMGPCPDLVPTVAVLAAFARGETRIDNVAHLRLKESDRLSAITRELRKTGVRIEEFGDGLLITGTGGLFRPGEIQFSAHNDHRIAMSLSLLEFGNIRPVIDTPAVVRKSFPDFWEVRDSLR